MAGGVEVGKDGYCADMSLSDRCSESFLEGGGVSILDSLEGCQVTEWMKCLLGKPGDLGSTSGMNPLQRAVL